ncbi:acetylxylan esterase [Spirosoma sp. SC4-14]|uniref:glucuronyl esterase domain-containing protein n=1 Tax=Spirosoma sp. SC4-14 TaxID=3128900 RepID=UPI0030D19BBA
MYRFLVCLLTSLVALNVVCAQTTEPVYNYEEEKVGAYILPDPLLNQNGKRVTDKAGWERRRAELLQLFAENVYGQTPKQQVKLQFKTVSTDPNALNGLAVRKQVAISFVEYPQLPPIEVLLYTPKSAKKAVPVFLGLNFCGNHCVTMEADIPLSTQWMYNAQDGTALNNRATEKARGSQARRWPIDMIVKHGYGVATAYYGDIEPDYPQGWRSGIRSVLGDTTRANNWGAIGAWAWGMSRIVDYLMTDPAVDPKRIISIGHSRIGKAALWAGAQDKRFAAVVANEAGEGGSALARRWYGETVERINTAFPHWFCANYKTFNKRVANLPVDQHELLALVAPRPLYVASAEEDRWSDPKGEFLSAVAAGPVYRLYGKTGIGTTTFPTVNQPVGHTVRYHIRTGKHDVTNYDWEQYLQLADELVK